MSWGIKGPRQMWTSKSAMFIAVIALFLFAMPLTPGDELPDRLLAHGKQECALAGINVISSTVERAEASLGKPTSEEVTFPEQKGIAGEKTYVWRKSDVVVTLKTEFIHDPRLKGRFGESPELVTVEGSNGAIGRTGRGLKLGDRLSETEKTYGSGFVKKDNTIEIQWKSGTVLLVTWNDKGLIDQIDLLAPE